MEWVTTTGKTVDEAKERALDQLGVHMEDAEFEVLEEPKAGLFGRLKGEARVRARVRPAQVRQKLDRRDRKRGDKSEKSEKSGDRPAKGERGEKAQDAAGDARPPREPRPPRQKQPKPVAAEGAAPAEPRAPRAPRPPRAPKPPADDQQSNTTQQDSKEQLMDAHQVGEEATRFMTGLIEAFGYTGTVELVEDGDDLELRVHGEELGLLVGPRGTTLQAVQDLARVASQRRLGDHDTRLRVDVGGYRERRRAALGQFAQQMAAEVKTSGVARVLEPMSSADRKVIHDTLADLEGIATRSEGDDPYRRVIIAPAND
jgi:spoIIIJ-associated protein